MEEAVTEVILQQDGDRYAIACKGHAEGSPEMCTAISSLVYAAAGWLRNERGAKTLQERLESGDALLAWAAAGEGAAAVWRLLTVAFLQLELTDGRQNLRVDIISHKTFPFGGAFDSAD